MNTFNGYPVSEMTREELETEVIELRKRCHALESAYRTLAADVRGWLGEMTYNHIKPYIVSLLSCALKIENDK